MNGAERLGFKLLLAAALVVGLVPTLVALRRHPKKRA